MSGNNATQLNNHPGICQTCGGNLVSFGLGQMCEDCKTRWYNGQAIANYAVWSAEEVVRLRFTRYLVRSGKLGQGDLQAAEQDALIGDLPEFADARRR